MTNLYIKLERAFRVGLFCTTTQGSPNTFLTEIDSPDKNDTVFGVNAQ